MTEEPEGKGLGTGARMPSLRPESGSPKPRRGAAEQRGPQQEGPTADGEARAGREMAHPSHDLLRRFLEGELTTGERSEVLRHLLRRCPECQEAARQSWSYGFDNRMSGARQTAMDEGGESAEDELGLEGEGEAPSPVLGSTAGAPSGRAGVAAAPGSWLGAPHSLRAQRGQLAQDAGNDREARDAVGDPAESLATATLREASYDEVLDRVFARVTAKEATVAGERARGQELFDELMQHPPAHQQLLVRNSARFHNRMLCEHLLSACHEQGFRDPARAIDLGRLAVTAASLLRSDGGNAVEAVEQLENLQARAWAQLGNALRIGRDFGGAEQAFAVAEERLGRGAGTGLLDRARVFDLEASLHKDQRRFAEACRLLDRVILIYRKLGQWSLLGRAFNQKATVLNEASDPYGAMTLLRRALDLLDPHEDPRMFLTVRHNLIYTLNVCGRSREAFALLFHTRPLYLKMGDRMNLLRLRWLEGCVAQGLRRLDQAEAAFKEVRDAYFELQLDYDAALVALDLAGVYVLQGRTAELRRLAEEMAATFESCQIHQDALAALLVFCNAARMEQASTGLVQELAAFLKRARNNPGLRFTPST